MSKRRAVSEFERAALGVAVARRVIDGEKGKTFLVDSRLGKALLKARKDLATELTGNAWQRYRYASRYQATLRQSAVQGVKDTDEYQHLETTKQIAFARMAGLAAVVAVIGCVLITVAYVVTW